MASLAYSSAGVNTHIEALASQIMYQASKRTWQNRSGNIGEIFVPFDDFSGIKIVRIGNLPAGSCMSFAGDGTGTKPTIVELLDVRDTIGIDLVAMSADDAVQKGTEPGLIYNGLDLRSLGPDERHLPRIQRIADGLVEGAYRANVAVINGELAQMGARISGYGDFPFNWMSACVWFFNEKKILTGRKIRVGDVIILLREHGFRCNGFTLVYEILGKLGDDWHMHPFEDSTLGMHVLTPSTIYTRAIVAAHGGFATEGECDVHGVAHFTGGGIHEKMARLLRPTGLGAHLFDPFPVPKIMSRCQALGNLLDSDLYEAWNGGQGMGVVVPKAHADGFIACAQRFSLEAKVGGEIVLQPGISIVSRGMEKPGKILSF